MPPLEMVILFSAFRLKEKRQIRETQLLFNEILSD